MRFNQYLLFILIILCAYSCSKDDIISPEDALLKAKHWYSPDNDESPIKSFEYQYDDNEKLERINHINGASSEMFGYEIFHYDLNDEIESKLTYVYCCDSTGWYISDSTSYEYTEGKITQENIYYPPPNSYMVSYQFQYNNSNLIREYRYDNQSFEYCIIYEYSNRVCTKETMYSNIDLSSIMNYTLHYYDMGFKIRSEKFNSQNQQFQIQTYKYDEVGNLIREHSHKTDNTVVAQLDFMIKYEYY